MEVIFIKGLRSLWPVIYYQGFFTFCVNSQPSVVSLEDILSRKRYDWRTNKANKIPCYSISLSRFSSPNGDKVKTCYFIKPNRMKTSWDEENRGLCKTNLKKQKQAGFGQKGWAWTSQTKNYLVKKL